MPLCHSSVPAWFSCIRLYSVFITLKQGTWYWPLSTPETQSIPKMDNQDNQVSWKWVGRYYCTFILLCLLWKTEEWGMGFVAGGLFFNVYMRAGLRRRWISWQQVIKGPSERKPRLFINSAINLLLYKRLLRIPFQKKKSEHHNNFLLCMNVPWLNREGVKSTNWKVSGKTDWPS